MRFRIPPPSCRHLRDYWQLYQIPDSPAPAYQRTIIVDDASRRESEAKRMVYTRPRRDRVLNRLILWDVEVLDEVKQVTQEEVLDDETSVRRR